MHAIYSDPQTWRHLPFARFSERARTEAMITWARKSRESFGLGPWAVRLLVGDEPGELIGTAGCSMFTLPAWNLGYRFSPAAWGHGYATAASRAGLVAAGQARPATPVTARALSTNLASIRVLERIGLTIRWRGRSTEGESTDPDDTQGMERVIAADRALDETLLASLIDLG